MIEMSTEFEADEVESRPITGYVLDQFVRNWLPGKARPIGFELGSSSMRVAYLVEGVGALARLNVRRTHDDVWQAVLHWGPRGARRHTKFQVVGSMLWVTDPDEYTWQGRAKRK